MSIIDTYGEFEAPEEKSAIEVIEEPMKVISSCYELFDQTIFPEITKTNPRWYNTIEGRDLVYENITRLFDNKEKLKPNGEEVLEFLKKQTNLSEAYRIKIGLFLTSLINNTSLPILKIYRTYNMDHLGYKLMPQKAIIINNASSEIGEFSEGAIINFSRTPSLGYGAKNAIILNFDEVSCLAEKAKKGIYINYYKANSIGDKSEGSILINQGSTSNLGYRSKNGIAINQFKLNFFRTDNTCIKINLLELLFPEPDKCIDLNFYNFVKQELNPQIIKLEKKIAELDFTRRIKNSEKKEDQDHNDKIIQRLLNFDRNKFQKDITTICEEIKDKYEAITKQ